MRVLYVLPTIAFGGAERQALLHIAALPRFGVEVIPVVGPGQPMCDALREAGVTNFIYLSEIADETHRSMSKLGNVQYFFRYFSHARRASRRITEIARSEGVDLIFAARTQGWIISASAAQELNLPLIVRQGSRPFHPLVGFAARASRPVWRKPTMILSNCRAADEAITALFGKRGGLLPNAVDVERFNPAKLVARIRHKLALSPNVPVVGLAARPAPDKGFDFLADVAARVSKEIPNVRFLVAGDYGWRSHYEKLYLERGLADTIRFLGYIPEIEEFFQSCDVVILTTRANSSEASPNALTEAMAMERPIVSTKVAGVPELLTDGVEGFLTDPDDVEGFSGHLVRLLGDLDLRRTMGIAGRKRILAERSEDRVMKILVNAMNRAVADRPPQKLIPYDAPSH